MASYQILVVEDEPDMRRLLKQALEESGFAVVTACNGKEGLSSYLGCDLLIVDIMMPVMSGFTMVQKLRESGVLIPVLFLTAKDSVESLVSGLNLGGDDYLVKPFRLAELVARVNALVRRSRAGLDLLKAGDIEIDRRRRQASRSGRDLFLSNTELALLECFILHQNHVLSKNFLLREIWKTDEKSNDNIVEVYVNYLRSKMETHGRPRLIQTVRGKGYVFESN